MDDPVPFIPSRDTVRLMGYELDAVLGKRDLLENLAREHGVPMVALGQGFALIPLTSDVIGVLVGNGAPDAPVGYQAGRLALDDVLKGWSARGPVVHVTSEMHDGVGPQTARMWQDGAMVFAQTGSPYSGPISMALQRLGVTGGRLGWDEFDVVGLGRHRRTARWLDAALDGISD